jgi:hypothetical protein
MYTSHMLLAQRGFCAKIKPQAKEAGQGLQYLKGERRKKERAEAGAGATEIESGTAIQGD